LFGVVWLAETVGNENILNTCNRLQSNISCAEKMTHPSKCPY